jgi:hypothetical protein
MTAARKFVRMKLTGMREALDNLDKLSDKFKDRIPKIAARKAAKVIVKAVGAVIYQGLTKRTGLLGKGLGANVRYSTAGNQIRAYVVERQVKTSGKSAVSRVALKGAIKRARTGKRIAPKFGAFYWRFLEFGSTARQTGSGANRGALPATGNVQRAFGSAAASAVTVFQKTFADETENAAKQLKKRGA